MAKTKLKPEIKEKWLDALLSGEYKQARDRLRKVIYDANGKSVAGYCCLGVLADVMGGEWVDDTSFTAGNVIVEGHKLEDQEINEPLCKAWGLDTDVQTKLIEANDAGKSFKWIAAYIKRYL